MDGNAEDVTDRTAAERMITLLERAAAALAAVSFVVIVLITVTDVVLRYAAHRPLMWAYDFISWYPMVALFFFVISDSWRSGHHIRVDLLIRHRGPRATAGFGLLATLVALSIIVLIAYTGMIQFQQSWDSDERLTGVVEWPLWPSKLIVPIGAALFALRLLIDAVRDARALAGAPVRPVHLGTHGPGRAE